MFYVVTERNTKEKSPLYSVEIIRVFTLTLTANLIILLFRQSLMFLQSMLNSKKHALFNKENNYTSNNLIYLTAHKFGV